jgi:putative FmdB family regulatory protein
MADMPIYEYECRECGHRLEKLQRIADDPLTDCPSCEAPALQRLVSAAAFRLKGSGWYETDFKKDNQRNLVERASDSDTKADKAADAKSDGTAEKAKGSEKGEAKSDKKSESKPAEKSSTAKADKASSGSTKSSKKADAA